MPIKREDYLLQHGILHVTIKQIMAHHTSSQLKHFERWMYGQTYMIRDDGESGIYAWDYERWVNQGMKHEQSLDWD